MPKKYLTIELGQNNPLVLKFAIRATPIAQLWLDRMNARHSWPMDHRNRFYWFDSADSERQRAENMIQQCVSAINGHQRIITKDFEFTQEYLNYLHNIFELNHGLLDQQHSEFWQSAPDHVRTALAELNLAVHRCESVMQTVQPRFVCTWFGMPKTHRLDTNLQQSHGSLKIEFGTVYLNYCEIGKTLEELENDNDQYIADDAFRPFSHYSADFNVQFYDMNLENKLPKIQNYIDQRQDFFVAHGITSVYNVQALPLRFPVADLIYSGSREKLLQDIAQRQWINRVEIE